MLKVFFICFAVFAVASTARAFSTPSSSGSTFLTNASPEVLNIGERLKSYDGKIVRQIVFAGLIRTKERAARWLMKTSEGEPFSAQALSDDVVALYNTTDLYNIFTTVETLQNDPQGIVVHINLEDKWTLLPFASGQGGGGSLEFGAGIFDSNLLGYFINASASFSNYNGAAAYDVNFNQEYIAGTQYMGWVDVSNEISPVAIHRLDDSSGGNFTWQRNQVELMGGYHYRGPVRLFLYSDIYTDSLLSFGGVNTSVYSGTQYRFHPMVIFGRSNIIEFFEKGHELTFHPTFANFLEQQRSFANLQASYKNVTLLPHLANLAFFVSGTATTSTPTVYQAEVGGYQNVRGYSDNRQIGPYNLFANGEYRPYLAKFRLPIIEAVVLQGCVFSDVGSAWGDSTLTNESQLLGPNFLWSGGLGLRVNFLHFADAITRFDVARTIHPDEGVGFSFGVGQFF